MRDWKAAILKSTDTINDAVQVLERESLRIVMVADEEGRLLGTVTDGDIRRALIQHHGLGTCLNNVMFKEPTTASDADDRENILAMMKKKDLLQVPLIDEQRRIIGLETIQQLLKSKRFDNPVFLMAGGFGKRLRPLTNNVPKPLLKIGSKPILETILSQFIETGFHNFYISTHYKAEMVRAHFGDGSQWGSNIQYVYEEKPLGTAGAIGLLPEELPNLPIIMMNGDLLTKVNFENLLKFHNEQGGITTMCVRKYEFQVPYGVIKFEDLMIKNIIEKPIHNFFVNAGIYVLSSKLAKQVDGTQYIDMPHLLQDQIVKGEQVNMFPVHEYWLDIGRMEDYKNAQLDIATIFP